MLQFTITFEPSLKDVEQFFIKDLPVYDFLDWMTTDTETKHYKEIDDYFKSMFCAYFNPSNIFVSVKRNTSVSRFIYTYRCEFEYSIEKFEENLFAYKIVTNHSSFKIEERDKRIKIFK